MLRREVNNYVVLLDGMADERSPGNPRKYDAKLLLVCLESLLKGAKMKRYLTEILQFVLVLGMAWIIAIALLIQA
jgi:hypothetical protein